MTFSKIIFQVYLGSNSDFRAHQLGQYKHSEYKGTFNVFAPNSKFKTQNSCKVNFFLSWNSLKFVNSPNCVFKDFKKLGLEETRKKSLHKLDLVKFEKFTWIEPNKHFKKI